MDETANDFHHGEMPIGEQVHTYSMFNRLAKWASLHIAVLMVIFVLWFCLGVGFFGGLVPGLIVWAAGVFFLRSKPDTTH